MADQLQTLLEKEESAATVARLLNEITFRLRESRSTNEVFNTAVEEAREALQSDRVIVYAFDANWKGTVVAESVAPGWQASLGDGIADPCFAERYVQAYQRGRVCATENVYAAGLTECHIKQLELYGIKANLVTPILANGKLFGLLISHQCSGTRAWNESEIDFLSQLAVQVGYALSQVMLMRQQASTAQQAKILNQISSRVRESLKVEDIFNTAVNDCRSVLKADRVIVYAFDAKWRGTVVAESVASGIKTSLGEMIADPCFAERYVQPYQQGRVQAIENVYEAGLTECHIGQLEPYGIKANLVVPILANKKLFGLLIAHQCTKTRAWKGSEIDFLKQVGIQVGFAYDQAILLEEQQVTAKAAQLLNQISSRIRESLKAEDIFNTAVNDSRAVLKADRVIVYKFDAKWKGTVVSESVASNIQTSLGDMIADPCFAERYVQPYQRGRVQAIENVYEAGLTECHLKQLEPYGIKANLVVPILANKKLFGLLIAHQCTRTRAWKDSEIDFLKQVGIQVGFAFEQAVLLEEQQTAARLAQLLNNVTSNVRDSRTQAGIFETVVEESRQGLQSDRVIVYKFDEKWQGTVVAESVQPGYPISLNAEIGDPCFAERYITPYLRGRVQATENIYEAGLTECHLKQLEPYQIKANLVAPIVANGKLFGLLIAHQCSAPRAWKESEIDFLKQLGIQVGFALDQVQLLEKQQETTLQAQRLNQFIFRIRQSLITKEIFNTAVENLQEVLESDRAIVYKFDDKWQGTVIAESVVGNFPVSLGANIGDPCFAEKYVKQYQKGRVKATENIYEAGLTKCHIGQLEPFDIKANLVAPILANRKLYGLLIVHQCAAPRKWKESDIEFIKQAAIQVGFALDQAMLLENQQAATQKAQMLNEIVVRIRETLEIDRIFQTTVQECRKAIKTDRSVIYRFDDDCNGKIVAESLTGNHLALMGIKESEVPCFPQDYLEEYQQGRYCAFNNVAEAGLTECHAKKLEEWQVKANIVVPILGKNTLYGLLGVHQCSSTRVWQESDIDFLRQIGIQVGYAMDQAILLQEFQKSYTEVQALSQTQSQQKEVLQQQIRSFMKDIEGSFDGDLTVRARVMEAEMGTVGDFFNSTIENLQELVLYVKESSGQVSETVRSSEGQVTRVSQESIRQAETIANAMVKLQAMTNSMQGLANNARSAKSKVEEGNQTLQVGEQAMNEMVANIKTVQQTVEQSAKKVKRLGEASQNISRIVGLIGDFSRQTNILALNASIEVKQTGEDGQDFGAIASEVRNLAEQSAEATQEIEQLVAQIQTETTEAVNAMESGREQVNNSTRLVEETRQKLGQIMAVSSEIRVIVEDMAQAATTEVETTTNVSNTMQEVAAIAQDTSAQSKNLAGSFTKLLSVADQLQQSVTQFKVN